MKDIDFKDKSSPRIFGKGVVIVIVVLFSSLSFVLGYFVGRLGREERNASATRPLETAAAPVDAPALQPAARPAPAQTNPATSEQSQGAPGSPNLPSSQAKPATASPKETGKEDPQGAPDRTPMPAAKERPKEASGETAKKGQKESASPAPQAGKTSSSNIYTVQLGALKNAGEAKRLRQEFEKKGYKTYVSVTKNKKHEKIYKIRVGEFGEKKEAEILALKLKKAEGLNAFVTTKN